MAGKSDYLEALILNRCFKAAAISTMGAGPWLSLHTAALVDAGTGAEVSGGSYARKSTAATDWTVSGTSPTQVTNANSLAFPAPTANWGTVTDVGVWDAVTGGNLLYMATLTTSRTINNGDGAPSFAASALVFTED